MIARAYELIKIQSMLLLLQVLADQIIIVYFYAIIMKSTLFTTTSVALLGAVLAVVEPADPYRVSDSMAAVLLTIAQLITMFVIVKILPCIACSVRDRV